MARLVATGTVDQQYWQRELAVGEVVRLGRAPRQGWPVPWDMSISREHADLELAEDGLHVHSLETARNPIVFKGEHLNEFVVLPDGKFKIGHTTFQFREGDSILTESTTFIEHMYTKREMCTIAFKNPVQCLDALCDIPRLMSESVTDEQFATQIVELVLNALQDVSVVAVVQFDESADYDLPEPKLMCWNSRTNVARFQPSRQLMGKVLQRRCNAIHLWDESDNTGFTMSGDLDWAFCTSIPSSRDRWCLYVSGKKRFARIEAIESPTDLISELRFAELTANFIGSVREVRWLERQQGQMRQFFSPAVVEMLLSDRKASLDPREVSVSVLFCDVRGFSKKVEQSHKSLDQLLVKVSYALNAMTSSILRFEGVIADFQGDASLAFWGWPSPLEEGPLSACRAALSISRIFQQANEDREHPLNGFQVDMALGYGHAIAGQIGSSEQIKVGVFGPVVNLTSRLEGLTKRVGASILIDGAMGEKVRNVLPLSEARIRHIARMRPCGMDIPTEVHQLLPVGSECDKITDEEIARYEQAVEIFTKGEWEGAQQILAAILPDDGPANFLRDFIADHHATAPDDWDGAINLLSK